MAAKDKPSTSTQRSTSSRNLRSQEISQDWRVACRQLLDTLWQCEDSIPFRYDVILTMMMVGSIVLKNLFVLILFIENQLIGWNTQIIIK